MTDVKKKSDAQGGGRGFGGGPGFARPVVKAKNFKGTIKRLGQYLLPFKIKLFMVLLFSIASTVFSIWSPKIMGKATTKLFEGIMMKLKGVPNAAVDFGYISQILITLCFLYIISALFSYIQQYIMAGVAQQTIFNIRRDIDRKLAKLPLKFYDSKTHGEVLSRITNDVDTISTTLQQSLTQLITSVVTIVGIVVLMLTISPVMTLISFIVLPVSFLITAVIAKKSQKFFGGQQKSLGELNGHVEEMFTGHNIIKAYGHEKESIAVFNQINEKLYGHAWKAQFISGLIWPVLNFVGNLGYVAICVTGGILVSKRAIEIGDIQAFIQYSKQFTQPITQTANIVNILQSSVAAAERVFELLDETEEIPDKVNDKVIAEPNGNVVFDHVSFGYKQGETLIHDLNLDIKQGQTVAIVGPTGAGKTTIVNLLMRFYEIDGGKITVDQTDIRDMKRANLRSLFGMVLQDTWLFNGTIKENIAYGNENASEGEIVEAAELAHADHFIRTLPEGYDTVLNEEGTNISQGQKQLLTIARALLADPAILIFDEATSSVDTRTEVLIQRAMRHLMKGRTNFIIAHRLSTIRDADVILVMNNGDIVEKGTHEELLAQNGFYAELYNSQFAVEISA